MCTQFGPCIKHKVLTALDRINEQPEIDVFEGVRLVRDPAAAAANEVDDGQRPSSAARSTDDESADSLDTIVVNKVMEFFKSRSIQFRLLDDESREMSDGKLIFAAVNFRQFQFVKFDDFFVSSYIRIIK